MRAPRFIGIRCAACGLVQSARNETCKRCDAVPGQTPEHAWPGADLARWALAAQEPGNGLTAVLWLSLLVAMVWLGAHFVLSSPAQIDQQSPTMLHQWLQMANLVFHEAGHWILAPLGRFLGVLGGSLMEVLIPAVCLAEFVRRGDRLGAAFALWWTGQALTGVAAYAADAQAQRLVLLGGRTGSEAPGMHDWNNLLTWTDTLAYDQAIGWGLHLIGAALVVLAVLWCGARLAHAAAPRFASAASPGWRGSARDPAARRG